VKTLVTAALFVVGLGIVLVWDAVVEGLDRRRNV
jgi:hypothetical protein